MTYNFDHIVNWKLLQGSHDMPGPDGGTCINEAAIVAAGLPYRKIGRASDLPPCFSRPIGAYAMSLNDCMGDDARQKLIPFVTRLAGTTDTIEIEYQRTEWIVTSLVGMMARYLPHYVALPGFAANGPGGSLPRIPTMTGATYLQAPMAIYSLQHACAYLHSVFEYLEDALRHEVNALLMNLGWLDSDEYNEYRAAQAVGKAFRLVHLWSYGDLRVNYDELVAILDGALKIGRRTPDLDQELIVQRMEKAKQLVSA